MATLVDQDRDRRDVDPALLSGRLVDALGGALAVGAVLIALRLAAQGLGWF